MTATPRLRRCGTCRKEFLHPVVLARYAIDYEYGGQLIPVEVADLHALRCQNPDCAAVVLLLDALERIERAFRDKVGVLQPEEFRARREKVGVSAAEMAAALRVPEEQLLRWETGGQSPSPTENQMIRAFFDVPSLRTYLLPSPPTLRPETEPILDA